MVIYIHTFVFILHALAIMPYIYSLQGGDEIDDIFGCSTSDSGALEGLVDFADTYNVAGGERQNVGDNAGEVYMSLCDFNNPPYQWCSQGRPVWVVMFPFYVLKCLVCPWLR